MPKLIPQTLFFGAPSVIYAQINSPKQFFPACIGFVDDGKKTLMSVIFLPAILRPEMAARILWAPGIFWFFLLEKPHAHESPRFRGVWGFLEGGGWKWQSIFFMGAGLFLRN